MLVWLIYALWLLLVLYLTVAAYRVRRDTHGYLWQSFGLLFAIIAAFVLPHLPVFSFLNFTSIDPILSGIGVLLWLAGMYFLVSARQQLGDNWIQTVSAREGHELVMSGPYRYVRHPMYTGGFVACIGSAIGAGGGFIFLLVLLGGIFIWRVGAEDRLMSQQFPDAYPAYMQRTKALIPFVW